MLLSLQILPFASNAPDSPRGVCPSFWAFAEFFLTCAVLISALNVLVCSNNPRGYQNDVTKTTAHPISESRTQSQVDARANLFYFLQSVAGHVEDKARNPGVESPIVDEQSQTYLPQNRIGL